MFMKNSSFISVLFLYFLLYLSLSQISIVTAVPSYTDDQVWNKIINGESVLIIDVRLYDAYLESHITTAIHLDFSEPLNPNLVDIISNYNKSQNILYCSCVGGSTAKNFAEELNNLGLNNIYYMSDDFRDWEYNVTSGSNPGTVQYNFPSSKETNNGNNNGNSPNIPFSDLAPINIGLFIIAAVIIILKKRK